MELDENLKNGSYTVKGYYAFKQVSLFCKKSKLKKVDNLLAQIGKIMPRVTKRFNLPFEVYFVRTDNRLGNLEWSTYSENNRHAYEKGFNKKIYGEDSPLSTITTDIALKILELYKTKRVSEISRELNLGYTLVRNICLRKSWKHL